MDRRAQVDVISQHHLSMGTRSWRKLIHYLIELKCLYGPIGDCLCKPQRVCFDNYVIKTHWCSTQLYDDEIIFHLTELIMNLSSHLEDSCSECIGFLEA